MDAVKTSPAQPQESLVEQQIKASFHAFEDENKDGEED